VSIPPPPSTTEEPDILSRPHRFPTEDLFRFREYVAGGPPVILPHAEYAIIEIDAGKVSVDLRKISLDSRALVNQIDGWDNPLAGPLRANF